MIVLPSRPRLDCSSLPSVEGFLFQNTGGGYRSTVELPVSSQRQHFPVAAWLFGAIVFLSRALRSGEAH